MLGRIPLLDDTHLAILAVSPKPQARHDVAAIYNVDETVSYQTSQSNPFGLLSVAKHSFEEPDALVCARPDLWEPVVGNCLGPPGQGGEDVNVDAASSSGMAVG